MASGPVSSASRRFGTLWLDSGTADAKNAAAAFDKRLRDAGVDLAVSVPYTLDPARLQEQADSAMAKLKSAGVTTVMFSGDPVAPTTFTQQATTQEYFPEWVIGNTVLADTAVFARKFDQRQWAHAFGITYLAARVDPTADVNADLYHWYFGHDAPAKDSVGVIAPNPALFFAAVQPPVPTSRPRLSATACSTSSPSHHRSSHRASRSGTRVCGRPRITTASTTPPRSGGTRRPLGPTN